MAYATITIDGRDYDAEASVRWITQYPICCVVEDVELTDDAGRRLAQDETDALLAEFPRDAERLNDALGEAA